MSFPDPMPLPPPTGAPTPPSGDPFTAQDRAIGSKGFPTLQVAFGLAFGGWMLLVVNRTNGISKQVATPLEQPWWTRLLFESALIELTLVIATVLVPGAMAFRRSRLAGAATAAARRPAIVRHGRLALLSATLGAVEGIIVFNALRTPFWWAIVPVASAAMWWAANQRPLATMRLQFPIQPTSDHDRWPSQLASLGPAAAATRTWSVPVRHHSREVAAAVARSSGTDHLIGWDTLDELAPDEQRAMVAHELGHIHLGHFRSSVRLMTGVHCLAASAGAFVAATTLGSEHRADPRAYATYRVAALVVVVYSTLVVARRRKRWERDADAHALELTRDPGAFERMVVACTRANGAAVAGAAANSSCGAIPPAERVTFARAWAAAHTAPRDEGPSDILG